MISYATINIKVNNIFRIINIAFGKCLLEIEVKFFIIVSVYI